MAISGALLNCRETIPRNIQASPIVETRAARELGRSPRDIAEIAYAPPINADQSITGGTKELIERACLNRSANLRAYEDE